MAGTIYNDFIHGFVLATQACRLAWAIAKMPTAPAFVGLKRILLAWYVRIMYAVSGALQLMR